MKPIEKLQQVKSNFSSLDRQSVKECAMYYLGNNEYQIRGYGGIELLNFSVPEGTGSQTGHKVAENLDFILQLALGYDLVDEIQGELENEKDELYSEVQEVEREASEVEEKLDDFVKQFASFSSALAALKSVL